MLQYLKLFKCFNTSKFKIYLALSAHLSGLVTQRLQSWCPRCAPRTPHLYSVSALESTSWSRFHTSVTRASCSP